MVQYKAHILLVDAKPKCFDDIELVPRNSKTSAANIPIVAHITLTFPERHKSCSSSFALSWISAWYTPVLIRPWLSASRSVATRSESYTKK